MQSSVCIGRLISRQLLTLICVFEEPVLSKRKSLNKTFISTGSLFHSSSSLSLPQAPVALRPTVRCPETFPPLSPDSPTTPGHLFAISYSSHHLYFKAAYRPICSSKLYFLLKTRVHATSPVTCLFAWKPWSSLSSLKPLH